MEPLTTVKTEKGSDRDEEIDEKQIRHRKRSKARKARAKANKARANAAAALEDDDTIYYRSGSTAEFLNDIFAEHAWLKEELEKNKDDMVARNEVAGELIKKMLQQYFDKQRGGEPFTEIEFASLECFNIDLGQVPGVLERGYNERDLDPETFGPLFEAICAKSHPRNMVVRFPSPPELDRDDHHATWESSLRKLSADYIDCVDYDPKDKTLIPRASSSLTLRFHPQAAIKGEWRIEAKVARICWERDGLCDVKRLELVGIIAPRLIGPMNIYDEPEATTSLVFDSISEYIDGLMAWRLREGNSEDLHIAIIPDTTPKSRAEAVCHTYKAPHN